MSDDSQETPSLLSPEEARERHQQRISSVPALDLTGEISGGNRPDSSGQMSTSDTSKRPGSPAEVGARQALEEGRKIRERQQPKEAPGQRFRKLLGVQDSENQDRPTNS